TDCASTSTSRARTKRRSSLFDELFGAPAVDGETDDRAWLRAMLDVEVALAMAQSQVGLVPPEAAKAIAAAADPDRFDLAALGRRAVRSANPVVPFVRDLRALVPDHA